MPMRRAEDGVEIGETARALLYRSWLTKKSRKCWERVTQTKTRTDTPASTGDEVSLRASDALVHELLTLKFDASKSQGLTRALRPRC
jgi:hypothetical protein